MITMSNIYNRLTRVNQGNYVNESLVYPVGLTRKLALQHKNFTHLKSYIDNWNTVYENESFNVKYLLETVDTYFSDYDNSSELNTALYKIKTEVIPSIKDLSSSSEYIKEFASKYDKSIKDVLIENEYCDRLLRNHEKLNIKESTSLDNFIKNNYDIYSSDNIETIYEACDMIYGYKMKFSTKFNVALENILYSISKITNIDSNTRKNILENVVDRFCSYDDTSMYVIQTVLENNQFYSDDDKEYVDYIYDDINTINESKIDKKEKKSHKLKDMLAGLSIKKMSNTKLYNAVKFILRKLYTKSKDNILDELPNFFTWARKIIVFSTFVVPPVGIITAMVDYFISMSLSRSATKEMLEKMRRERDNTRKKADKAKGETKKKYEAYLKQLDKDIQKVEDYEDTLYSDKENDERMSKDYGGDDDMDDLLEGTFLNLNDNVVSVEDYFEYHHYDVFRELKTLFEFTKGLRGKYIVPVEDIELCKFRDLNPKTLYQFLDGNCEIIFKLADWLCIYQRNDLLRTHSNMTVDEANEIIKDEVLKTTEKINNMSEDFSVYCDGDDDLWSIYAVLNGAVLDTEQDKYDQMTQEEIVKQIVLSDNIEYATTNDLYKALESNIRSLDKDALKLIVDCIYESNIIDKNKIIDIYTEYKNELKGNDKYNCSSILETGIDKLNKRKEPKACYYLEEYEDYNNITHTLLEAGKLKTKLKIANKKVTDKANVVKSRVVNKGKELNTKQKMASEKLDNFVDNFYDKAQRELSNKNREQVIKGNILPSFSTIIKMAIGSAGLGIINPALGAISFVGGLAVSKKGTKKEKQYILDEIEVQLELVEKKISYAESNNDMKALENLLKIKQRLQREKQRIIYNGRARNYRQPLSRD